MLSVHRTLPRLRAVVRHLPQLMGCYFAWVRHPQYRFRMMDAGRAFELLGTDLESFGYADKEGEPACLVQRVTEG